MQTLTLTIAGMTCGGCASGVQKALASVEGVSDVKVDLASGQAVVMYDETLASPSELSEAVEDAGFDVV